MTSRIADLERIVKKLCCAVTIREKNTDSKGIEDFLRIVTDHAGAMDKSVGETHEVASCPKCQCKRLHSYKRVAIGDIKCKIYFYPELGYYFMPKNSTYLDSLLMES